jgi:hypothetical protein
MSHEKHGKSTQLEGVCWVVRAYYSSANFPVAWLIANPQAASSGDSTLHLPRRLPSADSQNLPVSQRVLAVNQKQSSRFALILSQAETGPSRS